MKRTLSLLLVLALLLQGGEVFASKLEALAQLQSALDRLLATPDLKAGFQGVYVLSLKDHTPLYERNADRVFIPASNTKLLTSGFAIQELGSDFTFETSVQVSGTLQADGVLQGDLALVGSGDPTLTIENLRDLAHQVALKGVRRVAGTLRLDSRRFSGEPYAEGWAIDDMLYSYQTPILALNLNHNAFDLYVHPGKALGDPVTVETRPNIDPKWFRVSARTAKRDALSLKRDPDSKQFLVTGTRSIETKPERALLESLAMPHLSEFVLQQFNALLKAEGIEVETTSLTAPEVSLQTLASVRSEPLPKLLALMNKPSDNLIADCLYLACAKNATTLSWENSQSLYPHAFQQMGLDVDALRIYDGSGLSRQNLVSPRNLVRLLNYLANTPSFSYFYDSLPIAGVDGSLKNRMKKTSAENNCHAKTGSLSGVSSLSGYVKTAEGEPLVFSILMNHHLCPASKARAVQDKIVVLLAEFRRKSLSKLEE